MTPQLKTSTGIATSLVDTLSNSIDLQFHGRAKAGTSSSEVKYPALSSVIFEILWIREIMEDLKELNSKLIKISRYDKIFTNF